MGVVEQKSFFVVLNFLFFGERGGGERVRAVTLHIPFKKYMFVISLASFN